MSDGAARPRPVACTIAGLHDAMPLDTAAGRVRIKAPVEGIRFVGALLHDMRHPKSALRKLRVCRDRAQRIRLALACTATLLLAACASPPLAGPHAARAAAAPVPLDHLPALRGDYFALDSQHTGRRHHIYVRLPEGYAENPHARYPVVYVLDGDSLFPLLAPTHLFLHYDERLPEAILVGIAYGGFDPSINKRNVDFSAPGDDARPGEAGAPAFLDFLRNELLPQAENRYRIDPLQRVLLGQSRSGYFVLWSALQDPDLFRARIASNPAFTPARQALFGAPAAHGRDDLDLVLASGARDAGFRMRNAIEWNAFWTARPDAPWTIRHLVLPEGTHAASIGEVYRQAMTGLFREEIDAAPAQAAD
ncbi:esterase family protein [Luteimonas sp. BDR2-5]|nr:esterase family protein [Luteimonas sp. BDR2-5]